MVNKSALSVKHVPLRSVIHAGSPCPHCDSPLGERSAKMSKSLGNTVSPEQMIEQFGADTVRLFILFAAKSNRWNGLVRFRCRSQSSCHAAIANHAFSTPWMGQACACNRCVDACSTTATCPTVVRCYGSIRFASSG